MFPYICKKNGNSNIIFVIIVKSNQLIYCILQAQNYTKMVNKKTVFTSR